MKMKRRRSPNSTSAKTHSRWRPRTQALTIIVAGFILLRLSIFLGAFSEPSSAATNLYLGVDCVYDGLDAEVDIIAVHGLGSRRDRAWLSSENITWLHDFLPVYLPKSRILLYGYNADIKSHSVTSEQYLYNHADTMVLDIANYRKSTGTQSRPVIFLGHSLGGILVKSALLKSQLDRSPDKRQVKMDTCGVLFFGTPHRGADYTTIYMARQLLGQILPFYFQSTNDRLLQHMVADSETLQELQSDFEQIAPDFSIRSFYETWRSRVFLGFSRIIVPRHSAVLNTNMDSQAIPLEGDHRSIVKYSSDRDINFQRVIANMQTVITKCLNTPQTSRILDAPSPDRTTQDIYSHTTKFLFDIPYSRNPRFTGREKEIHQLGAVLDKSKNETRMGIVAIFGTGGMGKTSIVVEFALQNPKQFTHVIWINAASRETLIRSFVKLSSKIDSAFHHSPSHLDHNSTSRYDQQAIDFVKDWLCQSTNNNWLLIFDNAEDLTALNLQREFFPLANHGSIIITSRQRGVGRLARYSFEIRELDPNSAEKILVQGTGEVEKPIVAKLAKELRYLPLALDLASSYIEQQQISHEEYLDMYRQNFTAVASRVPYGAAASWEYRETLATTYELSLNQIQKRDPSHYPCVLQILSMIGFMDHENLDLDLLEAILPSNLGEVHGCNLQVILELLVSYSLIYRLSRDRFSIHPVVQTWGRERQWLEGKEDKRWRTWELIGISSKAAAMPDKLLIPRPVTEYDARTIDTIEYLARLSPQRKWRLEKLTSNHLEKGWQEACMRENKETPLCIAMALLEASFSVRYGHPEHPACDMITGLAIEFDEGNPLDYLDDDLRYMVLDAAAVCFAERGKIPAAIIVRQKLKEQVINSEKDQDEYLFNDLALSGYYATLNNIDEGRAHIMTYADEKHSLEPGSLLQLNLKWQDSWLSFLQGDSETAITQQIDILNVIAEASSTPLSIEESRLERGISFDLALVYLSRGDYQSAANILYTLIEKVQSTCPDDPSLLVYRHYLALAYAGSGDRDDALRMLYGVQMEWDHKFEQNHPRRLQTEFDLAQLSNLTASEAMEWVADSFDPSSSQVASRRTWSSDAATDQSDAEKFLASLVTVLVSLYIYYARWAAPAFFNLWHMAAPGLFIQTYRNSKEGQGLNARKYHEILNATSK